MKILPLNTNPHLKDAAKEIYRVCFPEDANNEEYLTFFFSKKINPKLSFIGLVDEKPVCALYLVTKMLNVGGGFIYFDYVVGAGTLPEYRNQGLMRELFAHATKKAKSLMALVPFSHDFYKKLGFFTVNSISHSPIETTGNIEISNGLPSFFNNLYASYGKSCEGKSIFLDRSVTSFYTKLLESEKCGMDIFYNNDGYALVEDEVVVESTLSEDTLSNIPQLAGKSLRKILPLGQGDDFVMFFVNDIKTLLESLPLDYLITKLGIGGKQSFKIEDPFVKRNNVGVTITPYKVEYNVSNPINVNVADFVRQIFDVKNIGIYITDEY